ncbi:TPA: hypothetical protein LQB05_002889, partial [Enterococcus faecium]|nr:hypothetical protein [Enterococcus faecium]
MLVTIGLAFLLAGCTN